MGVVLYTQSFNYKGFRFYSHFKISTMLSYYADCFDGHNLIDVILHILAVLVLPLFSKEFSWYWPNRWFRFLARYFSHILFRRCFWSSLETALVDSGLLAISAASWDFSLLICIEIDLLRSDMLWKIRNQNFSQSDLNRDLKWMT